MAGRVRWLRGADGAGGVDEIQLAKEDFVSSSRCRLLGGSGRASRAGAARPAVLRRAARCQARWRRLARRRSRGDRRKISPKKVRRWENRGHHHLEARCPLAGLARRDSCRPARGEDSTRGESPAPIGGLSSPEMLAPRRTHAGAARTTGSSHLPTDLRSLRSARARCARPRSALATRNPNSNPNPESSEPTQD